MNKSVAIELSDAEKKEYSSIEEHESKRNYICKFIIGVIFTQIYVLSATVSGSSVQLLERSVPDFELNAFRATLPLICNSLRLICKRTLPRIPRDAWTVMLLVIVADYIETMALYASVTFIPFSTTRCTMITVRFIFGLFFYRIYLKESITAVNVISILLCLTGVILVIQPYNLQNPLYLNKNITNYSNYTAKSSHSTLIQPNYILGCLLAAITGTFQPLSITASKRLFSIVTLSEYGWQIAFWQSILYIIISVLISFIFERPLIPKSEKAWELIALHSLSYTIIFPSLLVFSGRLPGNVISSFLSLAVIYNLCAQYTVLRNVLPGHRNWQELLGVFIVLIGSIVIITPACLDKLRLKRET